MGAQFFFFRLNRQNPGNFPHLTDLFEISNGLFFTILFKKKSMKIGQEKKDEENRKKLILSPAFFPMRASELKNQPKKICRTEPKTAKVCHFSAQ